MMQNRSWGLCLVLGGLLLGLHGGVLPSWGQVEGIQAAANALQAGSEARAWELVSQVQSPRPAALLEASPELAVWVAEQYRLQRRFGDAIALANHVVAAGDAVPAEHRAAAILVRANTYASDQNYVAARLEYRSLTENDEYRQTQPGRRARFLILDIMRRTGDHDGSLELIDRLRELPDAETRAYALYQRAHIAFDLRDYEEAREFIELSKEAKPDLVENLFLEARLNLLQDRLQDPELEIGSRVLSTYVIPGRPISLRMHDRNLAVARGQAGIPIVITTDPGGDRERVNLLASPRDPTLFRATIPTVLGAAEVGNNRLEVKGNDIVSYQIDPEFQRLNDLDYQPKQMMVVSDAEITASSGEWVTSTERDQEALTRQMQARMAEEDGVQAFERIRDTRVVRPGNPVYVQVIDFDRSVSDRLDTVYVNATATSGDSVEGIELTETEPHSGIFRGQLDTESAPPQARASDTAEGRFVTAPISRADNSIWSSLADGKPDKWFAVDLMAAQPLLDISLQLDPSSQIRRASLRSEDTDPAVEIASTHPSAAQRYGYIDLAAHFRGQRPTQTAAYLYTEVDAGSGGEATLKIGSCDGVVAWVNGTRVHNNQGGRVWRQEQDEVRVTFEPGVNSIMLRVSQLTGPWGASLTILDASGQGLASLQPKPPVEPGVVTKWFLFDRLTPENIRVNERVNTDQPIRIRDQSFHWVPIDVTPVAHMAYEDNVLRTTFHDSTGRRRLRWVFHEYTGQAVQIREISARNQFDEGVLPVDVDYAQAGDSRSLELGPGDTVEISYLDERRVREDELIFATMNARFHNATIGFYYDLIGTDRQGNREVTYDRAIRYIPGETDRLVLQVVDYDADVSRDRDRIQILVENERGDRLWMEAVETGNHAGEFLAILRLGDRTEGDTIAVSRDGWLRASYADRENTDGVLARTARVRAAVPTTPDLQLYRQVVMPATLGSVDQLGAATRPQVRQLRASEEPTRDAPAVTSLEADLTFSVFYPTAVLREGSELPVSVHRQREGAEPATYTMRLSSSENDMFSIQIPLRIGSADSYTILGDTIDQEDIEPLYVVGGDLIRVRVASLDGSEHIEGWYRLASDGTIHFTGSRYETVAEPLHVGDYLYVRVRDADQDITDGLDQVEVVIETDTGRQRLTLSETLPHAGIFTGRLKTGAPRREGQTSAPDETDEPILPVAFGGSIQVTYVDEVGVARPGPTPIRATLQVHHGDDGQVVGFSKRFSDEDTAVRTRLLTAEALFEMAKEYRQSGQENLADEALAEGREILEEAIIDYPHTQHAPHAEYLLANLAQELEDFQGALARFNRVLSTWPDSEFAPKSQLKKGIVLEASGDPDSAMDAYVELTYTYPGSELVSDAVVRMGQHFYRVERFDLSGNIFGQFQQRNPESPLAPRVLFLAAQSFLKGAESELAKAQDERRPAVANSYMADAIAHFTRLVDTYDDPDLMSESLYWMGDVYLKQGDLRQAYLSFRRVTFDYPESRWARFARGRLAENAQQFSRIED